MMKLEGCTVARLGEERGEDEKRNGSRSDTRRAWRQPSPHRRYYRVYLKNNPATLAETQSLCYYKMYKHP
jgi:hypothetical protein